MLVKWNEERIKVIPKTDGMGMVILAPGYTYVEDANWNKARSLVLPLIEVGKIVEEWTKIIAEQKANYALIKQDDKLCFAPATLMDLARPNALKVIASTFHVPTLEKLLEDDTRQDVRIAIMKQLVEVDKGNADAHTMKLAGTLDKVSKAVK